MCSQHHQPHWIEIPHTADLELLVFGKTIEHLFVHAAEGMLSFLNIQYDSQREEEKDILLNEDDMESLLVAFLNELLYQVEMLRYPSQMNLKIEDLRLFCKLQIHPIDSYNNQIKAVTYNRLKIIKANDQYQTPIVFDI